VEGASGLARPYSRHRETGKVFPFHLHEDDKSFLKKSKFLGAKSTSIRDCVRRSVGWSVGPSPIMQLRGNLVTSRLLREEEEEEETDYVAIPLRHNSFAPRD
jgi:hypothetical protein